MYLVEQLAKYVLNASYQDLKPNTIQQLKIRILDSIGCAIGAMGSPVIKNLREHLQDFGGAGHCTLIGGGKTAPDRAAFYNGALVRYLDFNDSYLAEGESCHPSDNLSSILAASEYIGASGRDFLTALAVAYHVQCRLSDEAPVRAKGFDHTTQGSFAVAAGVSKALGLDLDATVNALAISGTAFNALRVTRTGPLSNWKGLAYPNTAFCATHASFLARRGITGPIDVFEGNKGFIESIAGPFEIDWTEEALDRVNRTIIKKYNAEVHSQSALEGLLELQSENEISVEAIERIELEIFDVAYNIIGGGEEGSKMVVRTKEDADHSLPYMMAVALLDGQVGPDQYLPERIKSKDVQMLLRKVYVRPSKTFTERFPEEMCAEITLKLKDGRVFHKAKRDYHGFFSQPFDWENIILKFKRLSEPFISPELQRDIILTVEQIEDAGVERLMEILGFVWEEK
jgi:2-methylcitrate dehydratase